MNPDKLEQSNRIDKVDKYIEDIRLNASNDSERSICFQMFKLSQKLKNINS